MVASIYSAIRKTNPNLIEKFKRMLAKSKGPF